MNKYIKMFMDDNGLKVGENFKINGYDNEFWFDEQGVLHEKYVTDGLFTSSVLFMLILGKLQVEKLKKEPWKPEIGEDYWFVSLDWGVVKGESNNDWESDRFVIAHNPVFQTVEEAKDYKWFLDKVDEYKKPFNLRTCNYFFYYDCEDERVCIAWNMSINNQGAIFFGNKENVEKFLEEVGKDRIKKYWFNVLE